MTTNQNYISHEDLDYLDDFLLQRIAENTDTEGKDEGILCLSELDGFLTAVVSGPVMLVPSQWLPLIWGDFEPEWQSEKEFERFFSLIINIMNSNIDVLMDSPEDFDPLFLEHEVEGNNYTIVDEWCEGYMRGVALAQEQWDSAGLEMHILLVPILAFTHLTDWQAHDLSNNAEIVNLHKAIVSNVTEIYAYWLARRGNLKPSAVTVHRQGPRIGRNDLCPCGSGKKYKKCCLH